ncbi:MAG: ABC transporter ATP-binding protein [Lachnospiraceae bacterium]|nr:ABC transporter ATP-binding protein [Lachnospiraceae bacterium]
MLDVIDLNIEFHDHLTPETVVYDFDLHMDEGEIVGLVGESGSGKTMSALSIAGLLSRKNMKKRGTIIFNGVDILNCKRSELRKLQGNDISMVFQEPMTSLDPLKKIGWQVEESLRIHENPGSDDENPKKAGIKDRIEYLKHIRQRRQETFKRKEERRKKVIEALKDVELDDPERVMEQYPHELSGGMRQRVMIAAALICEPKLLICDEPTTALDVTIQAQIIELLKKVNREHGTAILFISHDLSLVKTLCSRVLVMYKGNVVETGSSKDVFYSPKNEYTRSLVEAIPELKKAEGADESYQYVNSTDVVLRVSDLNAYYPVKDSLFRSGNRRRQILKDISFEVKRGEILGLVGESGCGKSTLGKSVLGMVRDVEGTIEHFTDKPQMIFQDPYSSLNPSKTVGWILEEPLRIQGGIPDAERDRRVSDMLTKIGLSDEYKGRYPAELSGGQRQRVCIGLALMMEPKLIIADEPVSALDVTIQAQIIDLLLKLNVEMGISMIFISHDLKVVYKLCDRIMVMKDGVIVEKGTDQEVYFAPEDEYTKKLLRAVDLKEE